MPRRTKNLFGNAMQIAEPRIRQARAEQSALFWDMVRAATRDLLGKDRKNIEPVRHPAPRKA